MKAFPNPLYDARELALLTQLKTDYQRFVAPGPIAKALQSAGRGLSRLTPGPLKRLISGSVDAAGQMEVFQKATRHACHCFGSWTRQTAKLTLPHHAVLRQYLKLGYRLRSFDQICLARSYHAQQAVEKHRAENLCLAMIEGAATGAPGMVGVPLNVALSFLLYFRATQSIALLYGYDIHRDPGELQIASEVTLIALEPHLAEGKDSLAGMIGKVMLSAELSIVTHGVATRTLGHLVERGGVELLYAQLRATAHRVALGVLERTAKGGLEAGIFRGILEQVTRHLAQQTPLRVMPIIGACLGGACDTYLMSRVLIGANLIYHKRFLFEKALRVEALRERVQRIQAKENAGTVELTDRRTQRSSGK